jgi:hypothetical protein
MIITMKAMFCGSMQRSLHCSNFLQLKQSKYSTYIRCLMVVNMVPAKVAGDKGISETKSKQQSPCSNCMHQPVTSWGNVRCMHWPVMSQANACTYCLGSKVSSLSQTYLYSSYFGSQLSISELMSMG